MRVDKPGRRITDRAAAEQSGRGDDEQTRERAEAERQHAEGERSAGEAARVRAESERGGEGLGRSGASVGRERARRGRIRRGGQPARAQTVNADGCAERHPFTARAVAGVPESPGSYVLWHGDVAVSVGYAAENLRAQLRRHLLREPLHVSITTFSFIVSRQPRAAMFNDLLEILDDAALDEAANHRGAASAGAVLRRREPLLKASKALASESREKLRRSRQLIQGARELIRQTRRAG